MARARTARQRAASRRNLIRARSKRKRRAITAVKALGATAAVATGVYAVDRKMNTVKLYHNTSHGRATRIARHGYAPGREGRRPNLDWKHGTGKSGSHEAGRVFFAAGRNNSQFFGPATTHTRVRKKAFYKVAHLDNHPAAVAGGFNNFYYVEHHNLRAAGIRRPRYGRVERAKANVRIRRNRQGMT